MAKVEPILPVRGERNILITSALPYVNNVPHLGNIIGSVLPADAFARYCRARGLRTLYVCGSDQYGTASEAKAAEEGVDPATLCAKYHAIHADIYQWFRIGFDIFGQTPSPAQTEIVQAIFTDLWKNGYIEERESQQPYCPVHSSFLADRFIEGECSICGYPDARGDRCGNLLDPFEPESKSKTGPNEVEAAAGGATGWLVNPHCKLDGATPEKRTTKHLYLRLELLEDQIVDWFKTASLGWTANAVAITKTWIDKGLQPRPITRDLRWGVPIPEVDGLDYEEYKNKVFYVWFDACIGYISITKCYTDGDDIGGKNWEEWWKHPEDVEYYEFMGKDNVPFHSVIFPGALLGTKKPWIKVKHLSATEYLNYEGGKFSKSRGIGVFGNNARDTGIDPDIWRFYLLSRRPESGSDTEFQWEELVALNNNELLKNIGNLVQRVIKFCHAKMGGIVPKYLVDQGFEAEVNTHLQTYIGNLDGMRLRNGIQNVLQLSTAGNKFLQDNKLDNRLFTEEPERCSTIIGMALNVIDLLAGLLAPYMPHTSELIFNQLGVAPKARIPDTWNATALPAGHTLGEPKTLFTTIPASKIDEWREAYGGDELRAQKLLEAERAAAKKEAKRREKEAKLARKMEALAVQNKENEASTSNTASKP